MGIKMVGAQTVLVENLNKIKIISTINIQV